MKLTDTHCHLNFESYQNDLPEVLKRAKNNGIQRILAPGIDLGTSREVIQIAEQHPIVYASVGVHPNSALSWEDQTRKQLEAFISHPDVVAVGEIGLDYFRDQAPREIQRQVLQEQLGIARDYRLPVILHVRNKSDDDRSCILDLLQILEDWKTEISSEKEGNLIKGVIHSFSGNLAESERASKLGFYIGITGAITYQNAVDLRQVAAEASLEKLLVETDGPFITPHPYRGKRNEPAHIRYIVDKISVVSGHKPETVAEQTSANARQLFGWE